MATAYTSSPGPSSSSSVGKTSVSIDEAPRVEYRLYKRRFSGLFGFVLLGLVTGMPWAWFGPITTQAATEFDITVDHVNWLGNIICCIYIPVSLLVPVLCPRLGIARCAQIGALLNLIAGWVRYAGTTTSLSPPSTYALLMFGQIFTAIAQPVFQVLGPMYSEKWFDLKGRTTATMIIAIANPVGGAIGQLLSPLVGTPRQSVLVLAIICTAVAPAVFAISEAPPTPPTYAGSRPPQSLTSLCRAILGLPVSSHASMKFHERLDFIIITLLFGAFVGATSAISVLSDEWFQPVGYSDTIAGLLGASLLLSGIVASFITAPLFDRVFVYKLGITLKILVPILSAGWLSLIWAVRPNDTAALFIICVVIGICSMTMLPIALELGVELTRNADASAAVLWCSGNLFSIIFIIVEGSLRASSTANPPYNMNQAIIFHGAIVVVFGLLVFFVRARQARRELDETMAVERAIPMVSNPDAAEKTEIAMEESIKSSSR